jgi:SPP1 gp7 family putative phage head morphogenesis protein
VDRATLSAIFKLAPAQAVAFLERKGFRITWDWRDMSLDAHARAFTVAKAAKLEILQDIKAEIDRAVQDGTTLRDFRKQLEPRLRARGWWGKAVMEQPDGTAALVQLGSVRRLETIYRTNLQSAYMAGRYADFKANAANRPWLQYVAVMDERTRPTHAALNGKIFRHDDPIWDDFYPPNGYNCRCRVRALSDANLRDRGLQSSNSSGYLRHIDRTDVGTGLIERVAVYQGPGMDRPFAPDRGWSGNAGRAAWQPNLDKYPAPEAAKFVADMVAGEPFRQFWGRGSETPFAVGILADAWVSRMGAKSRVVTLSTPDLEAMRRAAPGLDIAPFLALPEGTQRGALGADAGAWVIEFERNGATWVARLGVDPDGRVRIMDLRRK